MQLGINDVATVVVIGIMGQRLWTGLRRAHTLEGRTLVVDVVRGIRWHHIWPIPFVLTGVIAASSALILIPGLNWGWWSAVGGEGNPVFGSNASTIGTVWEWLVPAVFMAMLIPALPLFAYAEEQAFRRGAEQWSWAQRALKVLSFGLVHALIGIPIGVALALSVGGAYFMFCYLREYAHTVSARSATLESTRAHTAYNGVIILVVVVAIALTATQ